MTKEIIVFISEGARTEKQIVSNSTYPVYRSQIDQESIFLNQLDKFINKDGTVAVLGGFTFFLVDYFGEKVYEGIVASC